MGTDHLRDRVRAIVESDRAQLFITITIFINSIVIGLETSQTALDFAGPFLRLVDIIALSIFVIEIIVKLFVYRLRFFADPWNVFDFIIVLVALLPVGSGSSVLRALRILRALRLLSTIPKMRTVVQALLSAVPAMGSVIGILALIFYVAAVMTTKLFGASFDEWFGTIGRSLYSLFQIMTLESWSMGIVRPVMEHYPQAWIFFVPFILITSFAVLNLFIAIIVNAMHEAAGEDEEENQAKMLKRLTAEIVKLRTDVAALRREASYDRNLSSREPHDDPSASPP